MATAREAKRIAILAADGAEKVELERPRDAVQQAVGIVEQFAKTGASAS